MLWTSLDTFFLRAKMPPVTLSAILSAVPNGGFVAFNLETGTATLGETLDEAVANLKEAAELHLGDYAPQRNDQELDVLMFRCMMN